MLPGAVRHRHRFGQLVADPPHFLAQPEDLGLALLRLGLGIMELALDLIELTLRRRQFELDLVGLFELLGQLLTGLGIGLGERDELGALAAMFGELAVEVALLGAQFGLQPWIWTSEADRSSRKELIASCRDPSSISL
ncbi:hypothetical protein [Sphingomonas sp. SRS2]|uniref:hypothetical protein n=1 Tax=Sphingomonas sp. SRS2 TaxID=133190 RepID=UPI0006184192|nr:hypothetical protein WP12_14930 [Sphingomonas sp. SRS2]